MDNNKGNSGCFLKIVIFLIIIVGIFYAFIEFGSISLDDPLVRMVQLSNPPGKNVRFEKAFRNFFVNPKWESIAATDGESYVNFYGKAFYGENIELYVLQFHVGEDNGVRFWKLIAIEVDGKPKNAAIFGNDLIDKVYEEF
jgi:hypothetical protein